MDGALEATEQYHRCADMLNTHTGPYLLIAYPLAFSRGEGTDREAHVSAEDASSRASTRFSRAHEDDRR